MYLRKKDIFFAKW